MLRLPAALFTGILLLLSLAQTRASAQTSQIYLFSTVTPNSTPSGSGDTVLVARGTYVNRPAQVYNLCFYTGVPSASIVPTSSTQGTGASFTFTVPGPSFRTAGAAASPTIYLVQGTGNICNGTNPGISNTFTYSISASNYAIRSASPSTLPSGSNDTDITFSGTFPTFPTDGTGLGLCFYNGTANAPLLPRPESGTANVPFTIPAADFTNAGTASVYLAPYTSTCNGTNPGYSTTLAYTITQAMRFSIQAGSPESLPAGGGNIQVSLYGNLVGSEIPTNYGVCFYTGPGTTPAAITPDYFTTSEIDFTVPSSTLQIPPSAFTSGTYNAQVQLGALGTTCTATAQGISNVYSVPIVYPSFTSATLTALAQVNPSVPPYPPAPKSLEVLGANLIPGVVVRFDLGDTASILYEQPTSLINSGAAVAQIPNLSDFTSTTVSVCNYSIGRTYEYCGASSLNLTNYPLAATTTQLTSNPASPALNSSPILTATITPGSAGETPGGIYVPGPPTGTVTFKDGQTPLGTAPLLAGSLTLANASSQVINVNAGTDAVLAPGGGDAIRPKAKPAASPNETPLPVHNSQFTSLTADFNQDGIPDLLLIQANTGVMHLFPGGSPAGTLQAESTLLQAGYDCNAFSAVTAADLNGDGFPDIAYLCASSEGQPSLSILLNQRDGTFPEYSSTIAHVDANQLAAADVNHDGKVDLVVTGQTNQAFQSTPTYGIQTYLNTGTLDASGLPVFSTPGDNQTTATTDLPGTQIVLKDLNHDGNADLALLHYNTTTSATEVTVFQGNGAGAFTPITPIPVCHCDTTTAKLFVTPITTGTLYPDIIVAFPDTPSVITALNTRTSTLAFAAPATQSFLNLRDAVLGDFNADGFTDLAWYNGRSTYIASGDGTGAFTLNPTFQPIDTGTGVRTAISLAAAPDLNLDGYADLLAVRPLIEMDTTTIESYVTTGTASASLTTSGFTTPGTHTLTTSYPGNIDLLGSSGTLTTTFAQITPTITYTPTPASIPYGTGLVPGQLTATAADPATTAAVPGTFTFSTPTQPNLQPGAILPVGPNLITATFSPSSTNYAASTQTATITVTSSISSITLAVSPATSVPAGTVITLTATLATGTSAPVYGQVNFCDTASPSCAGNSIIGSAQLTANGTATYRYIPAIGGHTYKAVFVGTKAAVASISAAVPFVITGTLPTVTTISATGTTGNFTLTAVVTGTGSPAAAPTGSLQFLDTSNANALLASATLGTGTTAQTLTSEPPNQVGSYPFALATGDFNGDGRPDLVVTNSDLANPASIAGSISILLGNGDGTFTLKSTVTVGKAPTAVSVGDFNHDGSLDLAVANSNDATISILLGNGDGTFTLKSKPQVSSFALAVGDYNGDGIQDLASAGNNGYVSILRGAGDGTFTALTPISAPSGAVSSADINHDGILDLVTAGYVDESHSVAVLLGNGDGTFTLTSSPTAGVTPKSIAIGDFNGDNIPDIAVGNSGDNTLSILLGAGDGTFTLKSSPASAGDSPFITIGDFNGDGIADLAVTNGDTHIYLGAGDGTFKAGPSTTDGGRYGITLADFNGDGLPDLATVNINLNTANIALNTFKSTSSATITNVAPIGTNSHSVVATYPGDPSFRTSTSAPVSLTGQTLIPTIAWTPTRLTLGTALGAAQLNATASGLNGISLPGTFTYTPPAGTLLSAGLQRLTVTFTPADLVDFAPVTTTSTVRVNSLPTGTNLSSTRNPSSYTQSTTLTAVITPIGGTSIIPITGPVTFTEGTTLLGTAQATAGLATLPVASLAVGTHLIIASYTGDTAANYLPSTSALITQTIAKATPTLLFPTPAPVPVGTSLTTSQLNAAATGVTGTTLPGTFTYTPALGSRVTSGPQTLTALFTPTDLTNYTTATITTTLNGTPVTLTALSATTAAVGDPAKTITLTGTGFVLNSIALSNGTPLTTTYVNPTTLIATIPSTTLRTVQTLQITVNDPTQQQTTSPLPFTVTAPAATVKVTAPANANPGDQPTIQSTLTTPYPVDVTATYTLAFAPFSGTVTDPAVQFTTGGSTTAVILPAGQTVTPNLQLQTGTVAGTISITLRLTLANGGTDITPAGLAPTLITIPTVVPHLTSVSLTRSGRQLTVNSIGYSNTRQVTQATFHFTPADSQTIQTPDTTIDVSALFNGWYSQTASTAYGSTFLYTQVFTLDDDATVVGQVTVTLSNGVGTSASGSSQP